MMNMQDTFPNVAAAALEYAARGWHVFPARIKDGSKRSYIAGKANGGARWGATTDPDTIRGYWQEFSGALLGITTGPDSGFFVIDADTPEGHDKDGVGTLRGWIEEYGPLPDTIEATTPSGGWHVYFRWPDDLKIRNSQSDLAPGIDVRGEGGMVLAPPTIKPGTGKAYRWKNPPGFFALGDCPEWLLNKIRAAQAPKLSERAMSGGGLQIDTGTATAWAEKALRDELAKLFAAPEGQRNGTLNSCAFNLGQIVAGGELTEATVKARLSAAAAGIGLESGEIAATIESGFQAGAKTPRGPKAAAANGTPDADAGGEPAPAGDPVDLWGSFDPPELPHGLLPPIIEDFARANGAQMGADPAGLAMAALATCAAAIPDAVKIKVKRHDDWCESARLWVALMGPPSAKKSPIISAATGPLCRLDVEMMRDWQQSLAVYEALTSDEKKTTRRPPQTRLRIEDATVEAAQQVLEGSPWGVLLLQDELSGFFGAMDKYNGGKGAQADRAFWLRSFNGGQFALNRVGRGAAIIDNLSISMLGGIQPEPLRKIAGDAVDDGLLQRLFPITLRTATMGRDEPMPPVNAAYRALIESLRNSTAPGFMGQGVLVFDDGAQVIRRDLEARHLDLQSLETINRKLASHIGKYDGLFARLCVIWHCIEHAGQNMPATVTETTAQRVADFLHRFLMAHAISFYSGVLGLSDDHDRLTAIAGYILAHKVERITNRDVQRSIRTMRNLREQEIRPLLEQLAALGWLDRVDPPRPSSPPHWQVNPAVHAKFKDRAACEKDRRSKARDTIQNLSRGVA
jgi:hypothetical protein